MSRPVAKSEIRIFGLDESVTKEEISGAIAEIGGCKKQEVKTGDAKIMANGLGTCGFNARSMWRLGWWIRVN